MAGSGLDVTFGSGNAEMIDLSADLEVALVLSVTSEDSNVDDSRQQAFGQNADGTAAEHECDETGVHGQRISSCSAQVCIVVGSGQALDRDRPTWVSDDANGTVVAEPEANQVDGYLPPPGVGDDGLVGGFRRLTDCRSRSNFADGFHDYAMLPPDVQVHTHETAISVDKEVQWPTGEDREVQCEIDSSRIFEKMQEEHLLRMEMMLIQKEILMTKLGL